ncbi:hypothetical protein Pmani_007315 [Petrolisthes manimaculis]|uniref:Ig-like domain-containing protein n=1 Tax=Petrolisthes manimaculis TaxID=1843537 RepID=A0AAE1QAV6_9EUCA|nr:hypothetical protein Pmani_007315 [Petrolisthes manimaculis]
MGPGGAPASTPGARRVRVWAWVVAVALTQAGAAADCPKVCECKWRDGKEVVACPDAHFIDVPRGLDPSTQVLDLRYNNLRILPRDAFVYTGLVNLQKVWLNFCNLTRLEAGAFRLLSNVVELDLSNNLLATIPSAALRDLPGLRELQIAHNRLTTVAATAFQPVPDLVLLDLSHNGIGTVEMGSLASLNRLEVLNLADNLLTSLPIKHLRPLRDLRVTHLDGNPWHCDCHLRPLSRWVQDKNLAASVQPVCETPLWLAGRDWQMLPPAQFVCAPVVTAAAPRVLAAEGENVTLACRVESEVEVMVTWVARNAPLDNFTETGRYSVEELEVSEPPYLLSSLTISEVAAGDEGTYRCLAENVAGRGHVTLTLQVAHQVAEVRVATIPPHPLLPWGALGGAAALAALILPACLLLYCRVRRTPPPRPAKLAPPPPPSAEASPLPGYQVVPTTDHDDTQPRGSQSWVGQEPPGPRVETRQDITGSVAPSSVAYVEVPKCGVGAARTTLDPGRWGTPLPLCGHPPASQDPSNQYPDLLDLPRPPCLPLHSLDYCTLPRGRSKAHAEITTTTSTSLTSTSTTTASSTTTTNTEEGGHHHHHHNNNNTTTTSTTTSSSIPHSYHNYPHYYQQQLLQHQTPSYQETDSYRSSSALNLALSEAASHAYYAHLPAHQPTCPPSAAHQHAHHPHALHDLMLVYRGQCTGGEGGCAGGEGGGGGGGGEAEGDAEGESCEGANHHQDAQRFEYHAAQLERFLREYRCLQEQLVHMKQSYQAQQLQQLRGSAPRLECCSEALATSGMTGVVPGPSHVTAAAPPHVTDPLTHVIASVHVTDPSISQVNDPSLATHVTDPSLAAHVTTSTHVTVAPQSHVTVAPLPHVTMAPLSHVTVSPLSHVTGLSSHHTSPLLSRVNTSSSMDSTPSVGSQSPPIRTLEVHPEETTRRKQQTEEAEKQHHSASSFDQALDTEPPTITLLQWSSTLYSYDRAHLPSPPSTRLTRQQLTHHYSRTYGKHKASHPQQDNLLNRGHRSWQLLGHVTTIQPWQPQNPQQLQQLVTTLRTTHVKSGTRAW